MHIIHGMQEGSNVKYREIYTYIVVTVHYYPKVLQGRRSCVSVAGRSVGIALYSI